MNCSVSHITPAHFLFGTVIDRPNTIAMGKYHWLFFVVLSASLYKMHCFYTHLYIYVGSMFLYSRGIFHIYHYKSTCSSSDPESDIFCAISSTLAYIFCRSYPLDILRKSISYLILIMSCFLGLGSYLMLGRGLLFHFPQPWKIIYLPPLRPM